MTTKLQTMTKDVAQHRDEIIERMVNFSLTDTLLFRSPDAAELIEEERKIWDPIVDWAKECMEADYVPSESLEIPLENNASLPVCRCFWKVCRIRSWRLFYEASRITKSVLLAAALIRKRLTAEEAFKAAFLEEIWQADKWGHDEEADKRREVIRQELADVEAFLAD